jgi:hypothetical protein
MCRVFFQWDRVLMRGSLVISFAVGVFSCSVGVYSVDEVSARAEHAV